jgi:deoxycytidylate deaminase
MLSKKEKKFINLAKLLAEHSIEKQKHGAVVVKSGRVVGTGFNKFKNHPRVIEELFIKKYCSRHAEEVAIRQAGIHSKGATLYVARINNSGISRNSKPCEECSNLIDDAGIKKVVYTIDGAAKCL